MPRDTLRTEGDFRSPAGNARIDEDEYQHRLATLSAAGRAAEPHRPH